MNRLTTIATTMLLVAALVGLVAWLRATAPASPSDVSVVDLLPPDDALTCDELESERADLVPSAGAADQVAGRATSGAVLSCPFSFDGLRVLYVGEVVGDVLQRDGGSWILANDDAYALEDGPLTAAGTPRGTNSGLTVWLPDPLDELADEPGRRDRRGDVLQVVGEVLRTDPADGGGLTIRAEEATVLAQAEDVEVPIHWRQVVAALLLAAVALATLWRERQQRDL